MKKTLKSGCGYLKLIKRMLNTIEAGGVVISKADMLWFIGEVSRCVGNDREVDIPVSYGDVGLRLYAVWHMLGINNVLVMMVKRADLCDCYMIAIGNGYTGAVDNDGFNISSFLRDRSL